MARSIPEQIIFINAEAIWKRVLLLLLVLLVLSGMLFAARWLIGNTIAEYPSDIEVAQTAVSLAPDDPQAHYTLGVLKRKSFLPEELDDAVRWYEQAASLAPNDFRFWLELGRMRAQAGDFEGGERALRRAVELAPAYAEPRWHLGNLLLRAGKRMEAFAELKRASEANADLRPQVINLAWQVFGDDVDGIVAAMGSSALVRADMVQSLVDQKRLDDAKRFWSSLSDAEKREQRKVGQALLTALAAHMRFIDALHVQRTIVPENLAASFAIGQIINGSFEENVGRAGDNLFGWQIPSISQTQIAIDAGTPKDGERSLRIVFNEPGAQQFKSMTQLVVVEPRASYRLRFWTRTDNLKSAATLLVKILDGTNQSRVLAESEALPTGTNDWQETSVDFTVPERVEAVTLSIARQECMMSPCPVFGKVWYDNFNLQRIGEGRSDATRRSAAK